MVELDDAFVRPYSHSVPRSRQSSKGSGREPTVKLEDEEWSPVPIDYKTTQVESAPAMNRGERKRKAAVDIGAENGRSKRLTRNKNGSQHASQQADRVDFKVSQHSFSEAPPDANKNPSPAAHIFHNERGVFVRPTIGWQFRKFEGTTKVWHDGK